MLIPGRHYTAETASLAYRFGFNGQQRDDEIVGAGNSMSAAYWQYDARLGRRWNLDPIVKVWESPYASFRNNPNWYADPKGLDGEKRAKKYQAKHGGEVEQDENGNWSWRKGEVGNDNMINIYGKNFRDNIFERIYKNVKGFLSKLFPNYIGNNSGGGSQQISQRHPSIWDDIYLNTKWLQWLLLTSPSKPPVGNKLPTRQYMDDNTRTVQTESGGAVQDYPDLSESQKVPLSPPAPDELDKKIRDNAKIGIIYPHMDVILIDENGDTIGTSSVPANPNNLKNGKNGYLRISDWDNTKIKEWKQN